MSYLLRGLFIFAASWAAACGEPEVLPALPAERPPEVIVELPSRTETRALVLDGEESAIGLVVSQGDEAIAVELGAIGAALVVRTDEDRVRLSDIELELEDIQVGPERFSPRGLILTGIRAELAFNEVQLEEDRFRATADVRVTWSLRTSQGDLAIRPLELFGLPISGVLSIDGEDRAQVELNAAAAGLLFDANVAQLEDLSLSLTFREPR